MHLCREAGPPKQVAADCKLHICGTVVCSIDVFFHTFFGKFISNGVPIREITLLPDKVQEIGRILL